MTLSARLLLLALFLTGIGSGIILLNAIQSYTANNSAVSASQKAEPIWQQQNKKPVALENHFSKIDNNKPLTSQTEQHPDSSNEIDDLKYRVNQLERQVLDLSQQLSLVETSSTRSGNKVKLPIKNFQLYTIERLLQGGIDETLAQTIVREQSETELKRLELQDKAKRENYYLTPRYQQELDAIDSESLSLRERIGDYQYDRYLYTSRINNRVKAASVMQGSAAEQAGIQSGDIILDYDGQRIFEWTELKDATTEGERGEYVPISILRNGELFSLTIPRGPLGVRLGAARIEP